MFLQQLDEGRVRIMTSASDLAAASACVSGMATASHLLMIIGTA